MNKVKSLAILPYKALKVLVLEGPHVFWGKLKFNLGSFEHSLETGSDKQIYYRNFSEYLNHATLVPFIKKPYTEEDLRIIGYMDTLRKYKIRENINRSQEKLVSIIMPTYNRDNYIRYAIESVLEQSYTNWELIIIDDGSTDNTANIVEEYSDQRIIYYYLEQNRGPAYARNRALEKAKGNYICYLDSDNTIHKDFILIMLNELLDSPEFDAVFCAQKIFIYNDDMLAEEKSIRFGPYNRAMIENRNYIDMGTIMHRRKIMEQYGLFNEEMRRLVDWEYMLRFTTDKHMKSVACLLSNYFYAASSNQVTFSESMETASSQLHKTLRTDYLSNKLPEKILPDDIDLMYCNQVIPKANYQRQVSIIIPNYECLEELKLCFAAIKSYTNNEQYEVIIVDNGSSPGVLEYLDKISANNNVQVIKNQRNYGFTYAVNKGIEAAKLENDIVLLNNDAIVTKLWLEGLQEVFDYVNNAGIVAPRQVLLPYTKTIKTHCPEVLEYREADVNISFHHCNLINPLLNEHYGFMELSFAPFFCAYITRTTINEIGILDLENGPHYRSDRIYCDAARLIAGKKVVYTPRSKVYHLLQKSTEHLKLNDKKLYKNMFVNNCWQELIKNSSV